MVAHAKPQAMIHGSFAEFRNDVSFRPHFDRIPAGVFGIPEIEVIVVNAHADEIFGAGLFVEADEMIRIERPGFPGRNNVLESNF